MLNTKSYLLFISRNTKQNDDIKKEEKKYDRIIKYCKKYREYSWNLKYLDFYEYLVYRKKVNWTKIVTLSS